MDDLLKACESMLDDIEYVLKDVKDISLLTVSVAPLRAAAILENFADLLIEEADGSPWRCNERGEIFSENMHVTFFHTSAFLEAVRIVRDKKGGGIFMSNKLLRDFERARQEFLNK